MRRVIVPPKVAQSLAAFGLPHEELLAVYQRLYDYLPANEGVFRSDRDPADPDTLFRYTHSLIVHGRWRLIVFSVCDSISPDHFFVETVVST